MKTKFLNVSFKNLSATAALAGLTVLVILPSSVQAITLVTQRTDLGGNDLLDWSSLGPTRPFNFLENSFKATSSGGLGISVDIPIAPANSGITSPLVFQTLPPPSGIPTNFASGDYILFTGFNPRTFPALGNPGPISITFDTPVKGAGTQIAVDDTAEFTAKIEAFDEANNLLGTYEEFGTSSLALDNSALFLGITSDTANISRLVFSSSASNRALGINTLSIVASRVPEPSFVFSLLGLGTLGVGAALKRKCTKA